MGLFDWFSSKKEDQQYPVFQIEAEQQEPYFQSQSQFHSTVINCQPDENGNIVCKKQTKTYNDNPQGGWHLQEEEIPFDQEFQEMQSMMEEMNKITQGLGGGFLDRFFRNDPFGDFEQLNRNFRSPPHSNFHENFNRGQSQSGFHGHFKGGPSQGGFQGNFNRGSRFRDDDVYDC